MVGFIGVLGKQVLQTGISYAVLFDATLEVEGASRIWRLILQELSVAKDHAIMKKYGHILVLFRLRIMP